MAKRLLQTVTGALIAALVTFSCAFSAAGRCAGALTNEEITEPVKYVRSLANIVAPSVSFPPSEDLGDTSSSGCTDCHSKQSDNIPGLYSQSTHARRHISCSDCHAGNPGALNKQDAHGREFIGRPGPNEILRMCGSCHSGELAMFKTSRHFPERRGTPRLDCTQCHGAHAVGAPRRDFSFAYYCSGCHGLEYLPELPSEFKSLLAQSDDLRTSMQGIEDSGRRPSEEVVRRRREIRRLTSEIVHPTDLQGGLQRIPDVLKLGKALKEIIARESGGPRRAN